MKTMQKLITLGAAVLLAGVTMAADGVTRTIQRTADGCCVTLAWSFESKIQSDLIIEERLAAGWSVNSDTVPFGSLDASWFNGSTVRFAIKPAMLKEPGSISFVIVAADGATDCVVSGEWQMYLGGKYCKAYVGGATVASSAAVADSGEASAGGSSESGDETEDRQLKISEFKIIPGGGAEIVYSGASKQGTMVVLGCENLGGNWQTVKEIVIGVGGGKVTVSAEEVGKCNFMKIVIK